MKIYIPTKGRSKAIRTHLLLEGADYWIVVHNEAEKACYLQNPTIDPARLLVSNQPYGLQYQRQWIMDTQVAPGEWFIFMDDNIHGWQVVALPYYDQDVLPVKVGMINWKETYSQKVSLARTLEVCAETMAYAEAIGAHYCGFAAVDNYFFRGKKWRYVGYIIGKMTLVMRGKANFDPAVSMEDFAFVAENLLLYGRVLINNYLYPVAGHYEAGGLGRWEERLEHRRRDCRYLMMKYPGMFRLKPSHGVPDADLALRFTNLSQVEKWRREIISM